MKLLYLNLRTLSHELTTKVAHPYRFSILVPTLRRWGEALVNYLASGDDIKIDTVTGRSGETHWVVFEPINRSRLVFFSREEVLHYLEDRYRL
ncbi:hypothetical protein H6G89_01835 [Oscillatoria sp. FACHB-1407]|uniref:hypothetical protein n=1 Tax=Oscillatoria sp. FACHB-1407 TaxID=2692847 RepID=UPI001686AE70|nr:hypothetical protein [Oscillatoria sp. FACHB-1407]MBD2459773.1 hypothetical protein [Oscillatoria sp. FACHB-1407]